MVYGNKETEYYGWDFQAEIICSNNMVPLGDFSKMLNNIFLSLYEQDIFAVLNKMQAVPSPSRNVRFPENGNYIMLGDKTIAEKMDSIRGNLKLVQTIQAASNQTLEGIAVMKEALRDLQEAIAFLRQHISNGKSIYQQRDFEKIFGLQWQVYYDDD